MRKQSRYLLEIYEDNHGEYKGDQRYRVANVVNDARRVSGAANVKVQFTARLAVVNVRTKIIVRSVPASCDTAVSRGIICLVGGELI